MDYLLTIPVIQSITFGMRGTVIEFVAMSDFPNRIHELRRARGWSQERLGAAIGCGKVHVSAMERGTRELTLNWMRRIANALGVSVADLLTDVDNPDRLGRDELNLVHSYRSGDPQTRGLMERVAETARPFHANDDRHDVKAV